MQDLIKQLFETQENITSLARHSNNEDNIRLGLQNLRESLTRLNAKYEYYEHAVSNLRRIIDSNQGMTAPNGNNTASISFSETTNGDPIVAQTGHIPEESHQAQFEVATVIEEYFQQVYVVLSKFGQVIKYLSIPGYESNSPPIRSNMRFIKALKTVRPTDDIYKASLEELEKARKYRSEYLDHYQGGDQVDWMTTDPGDDVYICYFKPRSNKILYQKPRHPLDPAFVPPNDHITFIVSPSLTITNKALANVLLRTLQPLPS